MTFSSFLHSHRWLLMWTGIAVLGFVIVVLLRPSSRLSVTWDGEIPLPFGSAGTTSFRGSVSELGTVGGKRVMEMTFDNGEQSESFTVGDLTFVLTPVADGGFSQGASLVKALTTGKRLYGYKYESKDAALERTRSLEMLNNQGQPFMYDYLFPGVFFASDAKLADQAFVDGMRERGASFVSLSDVPLVAEARYLIIVEENREGDNPADAVLTVRNLTWCGDEIVQEGETCDDSNIVDGDGCSAVCQKERALGDVDNDGDIDTTDYQLIEKHINGIALLPDADLPFADVQRGKTDVVPTLTVADYYVARCAAQHAGTPLPVMLGDVDGTKILSGADAHLINQQTLGMSIEPFLPFPEWKICTTDADANGALAANDANLVANAGLHSSPLPVTCGNGIIEDGRDDRPNWGEQCDDSNIVDGDGCSAVCQKERALGDVDNDGDIDTTDYQLIEKHINGIALLPDADLPFADVQRGKTDVVPTLTVADYYVARCAAQHAGTPLPVMLGDVDGTKILSGADAHLINQQTLGMSIEPFLPFPEWKICTTDADANGALAANDANLVANAGLHSSPLPVTCGNGIIEDGRDDRPNWGEQCDRGSANGPSGSCSLECKILAPLPTM
ncbi:MAG: DUF4215 domain-containing protein [Candidatus Peribacteraceae bacterium]|nr:DUF4215 domain-containing protein [Candidatus Peribacteraceae bacterium]